MPATRPVMERALEKVDRTGSCWQWTGATTRAGYGQVRASLPDRRTLYAHRLFYEAFVGAIPDGMQVDHLCRNTSCVNPAHLEAVTQRENLMRGQTTSGVNLAKTHCVWGHPFDDENTYVSARGHRTCRACRTNRERQRRRAD